MYGDGRRNKFCNGNSHVHQRLYGSTLNRKRSKLAYSYDFFVVGHDLQFFQHCPVIATSSHNGLLMDNDSNFIIYGVFM
jgi:hypothetical protein